MFKFENGQTVTVLSSIDRPDYNNPGERISKPFTGPIVWRAESANPDDVTGETNSYGVTIKDDLGKTHDVEYWENDLKL